MIIEWFERHRRIRYQVVFGFLLVALVASPLIGNQGIGGFIVDLLILASCLSAGVGGLGAGRGLVVVGFAFGAIALRFYAETAHEFWGLIAAMWLTAAASATAVTGCVRTALRSGHVTRERLFAASSAYLLAGVGFAGAYRALSLSDVGSFSVLGQPTALDPPTAIYFSFVTLTTVGYGDVLPLTALARSMANFEAVGAQLFVAILIARLVGLETKSES